MIGGAGDEYGTQSFKMGGAILAPFANRIRGKLSATVRRSNDDHGKKMDLIAELERQERRRGTTRNARNDP